MTTETRNDPASQETESGNGYLTVSRNFLTRFVTALVLLPLFILTMYNGGIIWAALLLIPATVGVLEFYMLARNTRFQGTSVIGVPAAAAIVFSFYFERPLLGLGIAVLAAVLAFALESVRLSSSEKLKRALIHTGATTIGLFYVAFPLAFLVAIRNMEQGFLWLVVICAMTWGTDTFAYFGGRMWGKHKLAPRLSPKKTVEGAIVGAIGGFLLPLLFLMYAGEANLTTIVIIALGPLVAIVGDLEESAIKRTFNVKDSFIPGFNIVPGHGGMLDRIDALLVVSVYTYAFLTITNIAA